MPRHDSAPLCRFRMRLLHFLSSGVNCGDEGPDSAALLQVPGEGEGVEGGGGRGGGSGDRGRKPRGGPRLTSPPRGGPGLG